MHASDNEQGINKLWPQKNCTEATYYLFSLTCLYKYLSLQTIPTNLKVGLAAIFHKTIEIHYTCYLVTKHLVWFQIWQSPHEKVYVKFHLCFNEHFECSVVIWFQANLNLTFDLPSIITKKLTVFWEIRNIKICKEIQLLWRVSKRK